MRCDVFSCSLQGGEVQNSEHHQLLSFAQPCYDCTVLPSCRAVLSVANAINANATCHVVDFVVIIICQFRDVQCLMWVWASGLLLFPCQHQQASQLPHASSFQSSSDFCTINKHVTYFINDSMEMFLIWYVLMHVYEHYYGASFTIPAPFCAGSMQHWAGKHESHQGGWALLVCLQVLNRLHPWPALLPYGPMCSVVRVSW